jgi:hypothetical protein
MAIELELFGVVLVCCNLVFDESLLLQIRAFLDGMTDVSVGC